MTELASQSSASSRDTTSSVEPEAARSGGGSSKGSVNAWVCLAAWSAFAVPMFLKMPLTNDTCLFDIQARMVTQGGTLYKDMHEPNLPGVVWLQMLARAIGGESSVTMRFFDLAFFIGILSSVVLILRRQSAASSRQAAWTITGLSVFYFGLSEWCHCQRDTWVVLPVLAGAMLRMRQIERASRLRLNQPSNTNADAGRQLRNCPEIVSRFVRRTSLSVAAVSTDKDVRRTEFVSGQFLSSKVLVTSGVLEGLVWACGIWIKPHILISIVAVWIISWRSMPNRRAAVADTMGLLVGGLLGGAIGIGWLMHVGAWPHFVDTLSNWNPDYLAAGRENWTAQRFSAMFIRFFPWLLVHLVAAPIALAAVWRSIRRLDIGVATQVGFLSKSILAAVYLTWLVHSFLLQHLFDYVHVPAVILAVALVSLHGGTSPNPNRYRNLGILFACLVVSFNPLLSKPRISLWQASVTTEASVELQDRLAHFENPRRSDLLKIEGFLRSQNVSQHDVCCFNSDCVSIYWDLNLLPATRFTYLFELMNYHPTRAADFQSTLESNPHRFIVTDLVSSGMSFPDAMAIDAKNPLMPPKYPRAKDTYPWSHPVVFRAGTYLVHEVQQPIGSLRMPRKSR